MTPRRNQRHTAFLITMRQSPATIRPLEAVWRRGINCWRLIGWMIRMAAKTSVGRWIVLRLRFCPGQTYRQHHAEISLLASIPCRHYCHSAPRLGPFGIPKRPVWPHDTAFAASRNWCSTQPSDTLAIAAQCSWKMISGNITTQTKTHKRKSRCTQLPINAIPRQ